MEKIPNKRKELEGEIDDLKDAISDAKDAIAGANKRREELLAKKNSQKKEEVVVSSTIEKTLNTETQEQPIIKGETELDPEKDFTDPLITPDEVAEYLESRADQNNLYIKMAKENKARTKEIVKARGALVFKYIKGEISAKDMLDTKPFGYKRKELADADFVNKTAEEEVAFWKPKLEEIEADHAKFLHISQTEETAEEETAAPVLEKPVETEEPQSITASENPLETEKETKQKEQVKEPKENASVKDPLETELLDISKGPKTEDAEAEVLGTEENIKKEDTKEGPKHKTKSESSPKTETSKSKSKPTNTLELGKSIRDIRRSKPRGFLLNSKLENPREEKEVENQIKSEIKSTPEKNREKIDAGIHNLGFRVERQKNEYFAKTFDWLASKQGDQKGTIARFTRGLSDSYKKESEAAEKKARLKDPQMLTKVSNVAYLAKNVLRPVRLLMDATGMSPLGAQRLVMSGAMVSGRTTAAMKEARLANEEVIEKNRLTIDKATEEAWNIYKNASDNGDVSTESLQNVYLRNLPQDLQKRLEDTTVAKGFLQSIFRKHMAEDVDILKFEIIKIEENEKLSQKQKKAKVEQKIAMFEKKLLDYDRMLAQSGEIDEWAMSAKYAESTSKNVVRVMTIQTLYLLTEKLWHGLSDIVSSHRLGEIVDSIKSHIPHRDLSQHIPTSPRADSLDHNALVEQARQKVEEEMQLPKVSSEIGVTEKYEHVDPTIKLPESTNTEPKLDQLHDVIKHEVNNQVVVTTHTKSGDNVTFGPQNTREAGTTQDYYTGRSGPEGITRDNRPSGQNTTFGGGRSSFVDQQNLESVRQSNAFIVHNLEKVFPENTRSAWTAIKSIPAKQILETSEQNADTQNLGNLIAYMKRLEEVTGLEPKGRGLFNWKAESTEDFVKRAVEWARINGQLKDIEIQ